MNDVKKKAKTLWQDGLYQDAISVYYAILKDQPNDVEVLQDLTHLFYDLGSIEQCFQLARRLETVDAQNIQAQYYQALCLFQAKKLDLCQKKLRNILKNTPSHKKSLQLLSQVFFFSKKFDLALRINEQIQDDDIDTLLQRALLLLELGFCSQSNQMLEVCCTKISGDNPTTTKTKTKSLYSNYLHTMLYIDDMSNEMIRTRHLEYMKIFCTSQNISHHRSEQFWEQKQPKIRIGYISSNLYEHPVASCLLPIIEHHNREFFEIILFSTEQPRTDHVTKRFQHIADGFVVVQNQQTTAYRQIKDQNIDILIDTIGHTGNHLLSLLQKRLAPIQISMIGYCGPTGILNMDYVIVDWFTMPENQNNDCFHEILLRQKSIFAPYMCTQKYLPKAMRKSESKGIRFGSTHKIPKITPQTIQIWSRVLQHFPQSKLCFYRDDFCDLSIQNVVQEFQKYGISYNQLEFHNQVTHKRKSHLEIYQEIDILLDTQPWSGHITACESLLMGVPVLSCTGKNHASRMVASILYHMNKEEWIAHTPTSLVDCAEIIAKQLINSKWTTEQRQKLRKDFLRSPICNGKLYTEHFEDELKKIIAAKQVP